MYRAILAGAAFLALSFGTVPAMAQDETPPPPCSTEEYRQLDFWVGEWDAMWIDGDGVEQHGQNSISLDLDNCVVLENFNGNPGNALIGRSMSIYAARQGVWKQVWMDNQGGYLPFSGGPDEGGFHFTLERASEAAPHLRMIFRNITDDEFDWHWQNSQDGGETWADQWHISYTRTE
jgi:hypothetical protein